MAWALREDLYFCLTDRCAIFLDLAANRYFGLTGSAELAFRSIVDGDTIDHDLEHALRPLQSTRMLHRVDEACAIAPAEIEHPVFESRPGEAGFRETLAAVVQHGFVWTELKTLGLRRAILRRRARKYEGARFRDADSTIAANIIAAHFYVDRLVGGADRCLARSLALIDQLATHDIYPTLVIGVRAGEFSAHCWVQNEATVLNDSIDRVELFTPILVL